MEIDTEIHYRRSIRLPGHDYGRSGWYFVTVCSYRRGLLFGEVADGAMRANNFGEIIAEEWLRTAVLRPAVTLDAFVVTPNHIHGILVMNPAVDGRPDRRGTLHVPQMMPRRDGAAMGERFGRPTSNSIPTIVRLFKSATTKRINLQRGMPDVPVWQRNYYEHVIRDEKSLDQIRFYIQGNPARWGEDKL